MKSSSGIYHIMLRGVNRRQIFHDDEDCIRFLQTVGKYKLKSELGVYAWCLMGNHVHLLLSEGREDLSVTMKRIGVSYVWFYNQKYSSVGHLFQDRFRSESVETDGYLMRVSRYIHQNPVKAGLVKSADEWLWSSCQGYYGRRSFPDGLLDEAILLRRLADDLSVARREYKKFNERVNDDECPFDRVNDRIRLSDEEAAEAIKEVIGPR
ncbi:transposase [Salipaludibacillus sp. HK11]|uniref:transposase n=1 Tax=Salipaludibacillus sp. HK11 TaxID=3394320 RepID=UPI0039FCB91D